MKSQRAPKKIDKYRCKWRRCRTSLHNLETLRRHVLKVHKPTEDEVSQVGGFVCWWKKCEHLEADDDGNVIVTHVFESLDGWSNHIQHEHIYAVAMRYGDGPPTRPIDSLQLAKDRLRYLSDDNNLITTPAITERGQSILPADTLHLTEFLPNGPQTFKQIADMEAQRSFFKVHGIVKDQRKQSEEIIRAITARKEKIGPGIDRGGCTLINDARRATFVQNPGIRRVVDIDY